METSKINTGVNSLSTLKGNVSKYKPIKANEMEATGKSELVFIDADIYPNPNGILAMNLAGKYTGRRCGWYGARELKYDNIHREFIFIVYDFDYYVSHII